MTATTAGRQGGRAAFLTLLAAAPLTAQQPGCAADNAGLTLPDGFCAVVVAEGLGRARHIAVASNGDVFVAVQAPPREAGGGIVGLRDTDGDGVADRRERLVENPQAGDVQLVTLGSGSWIYYSTYHEVIRHRWTPGELAVSGPPDTVARGLAGARQHGIKTFVVGPDNRLYVNHGAPSNSCQREDRTAQSPGLDPCPLLDSTGGIWVFDADRSGQTRADARRYATGMRNTVALAFRPADRALYAAIHGRDMLAGNWGYPDSAGAEKPAEVFVRVMAGSDFGWPYCYFDNEFDRYVLAPEYGGDRRTEGRCAQVVRPVVAFPAHWAPNGLTFHSGTGVPERYRGGAFLAFHGSWNRAPLPQQGFKVVFIPFQGDRAGRWEVFADGFQDREARPVDVAAGPDGSLYVSDDRGGRVYRIGYRSR
jgi:glucose/arabinose dehydrogenase